jgi:hypothetical protein
MKLTKFAIAASLVSATPVAAEVDPTHRPRSAAVREWRTAQAEVASDIRQAIAQSRTSDLQRLIYAARRLTGEAPNELGYHGRIHCVFATNSLANWAASVRDGKVSSAVADRREWGRYQRDCYKAMR